MKVTFHKAIDAVNNFMSSLKTLSTMENIDSVLTSGTKKMLYLEKSILN